MLMGVNLMLLVLYFMVRIVRLSISVRTTSAKL